LLKWATPLAVVRFVVTVRINPIKCLAGWTVAHVFKECLEEAPAFAYGDTTPAITIPGAMSWFGAALPHRFP
jgi:hypothetical protein